MTNEKAISTFFDGVKKDITADQIAKGIKASGASAQSLKEDKISPEGGQLKGSSYFNQQITGRRPGSMPPVEDILAWIRVKGIHSNIPAEDLAWAISKKIQKVGTDIHLHRRHGLDFNGIVAKNKRELIANLIKGTTDQIKTELRLAIKS